MKKYITIIILFLISLLYSLLIKKIIINNSNFDNENIKKNCISIIVKDNNEIIEYSIKNNIQISVIPTISTIKNNFNKIFDSKVTNEIIKNNKFKNICYIDNYDKDYIKKCQNKKYYLVKSNNVIGQNKDIIVNLNDIIYIDNKVTINTYKKLLKKISYYDIKIVILSDMLEIRH